jgi:hypothetical protein
MGRAPKPRALPRVAISLAEGEEATHRAILELCNKALSWGLGFEDVEVRNWRRGGGWGACAAATWRAPRRRCAPCAAAAPLAPSPCHPPPSTSTSHPHRPQFSKISGGISNILVKVEPKPPAGAEDTGAAADAEADAAGEPPAPGCCGGAGRRRKQQRQQRPDPVVVKVFGEKTELLIDRAAEAKAVVALGAAGFGPKVRRRRRRRGARRGAGSARRRTPCAQRGRGPSPRSGARRSQPRPRPAPPKPKRRPPLK